MTLQELFDQSYKLYLTTKGTRQTSIELIQGTLDHWHTSIGNVEIDAITDEMVWEFTGKQLERVKNDTVRKYLRNLKSLLIYSVKKKHRIDLPDIIMPEEQLRHASDTFAFEEIQLLLKATSMFNGEVLNGVNAAEWWKSLLTFIYHTAIRPGTATAVEFGWVTGNMLTIKKQAGVKTSYNVPLGKKASQVMRRMRQLHCESRIFPWPYCRTELHKRFRKLCIAAGIPGDRQFGFRGIRKHTISTVARTDLAAAVKLGGHSDPKITLRYYTNDEIVCSEAIEKLKPLEQDGVAKRMMKFIFRKE